VRHQRVLGRVDRDPIQPRIERTIAAERSERPVGFQKSLLGYVLGLGGIVHEASDQLQHAMLILQHQQIEGRLIAGLYPAHQFLIGIVRCHRQAGAPCLTIQPVTRTAVIDWLRAGKFAAT
jgi:hypothetical protein